MDIFLKGRGKVSSILSLPRGFCKDNVKWQKFIQTLLQQIDCFYSGLEESLHKYKHHWYQVPQHIVLLADIYLLKVTALVSIHSSLEKFLSAEKMPYHPSEMIPTEWKPPIFI